MPTANQLMLKPANGGVTASAKTQDGCCQQHRHDREPEITPVGRISRTALKAPIYLYRYSLKAWFGWHCRHLPTCSEYGLEAIETNGAWRGFWLTLSRLARCQPYGTTGYDPVPDIRKDRYALSPWRYGRWTGAHIKHVPPAKGD